MLAFAQGFKNPVEDYGIMNYLFDYLGAVVFASMPFLIIALLVAGALFIFARGKTDQLDFANKTFLKIILIVIAVVGAVSLFNLLLNAIMSLYYTISS